MGSTAPKPRLDTYTCSLFLEIHRLTEEAAEKAEEPDHRLIAELIADALAHKDSRRPVLLGLATFVSSAMAGATPDPERWCPPRS